MKKDVKPLFEWAKENGDCAIVERIVVKMLPSFLAAGMELTASSIESLTSIEVDQSLYDDVKKTAEELVSRKCNW